MSFLPHAPPSRLAWFGSLAASTILHGGIISFLLFSGAVVFLRESEPVDAREVSFDVSLEILSISTIDESIPIEDLSSIPEDAVAVIPDALEAEVSEDDFDALAPDEALLEPDLETTDPSEIAMDEIEPEVAEPDLAELGLLEPEVTEPEAFEPEVFEPEVAEPEVIEPELEEPQLAEVLPESNVLQVPVDSSPIDELPLVIQNEEVAQAPLIEPEPLVEQPIAIDNISPIDNSVLSPLAEGGSGPLEPALLDSTANDLALLLPEPEALPPVNLPQVQEAEPEVLPEVLPEPEVVAPEVTEPEVLPEPVAPEDLEPEADAEPAVEPEAEAVAVAVRPKREPLANPTASDIAIGKLLRRIKVLPQEQCILALPRRAGGTVGAGVSLIGADAELLEAYADTLVDGLGFDPILTNEVIDLRQCALLDAIRQSESYPANRIGLSLESTALVSGDPLRGKVIGAAGMFLTLLLIDDNGVVQDLAPFITLEGSTPVFDVPAARSGPSRVTRQILVALGTTDVPIDVSARIGRVSQDVFAPIAADTLNGMVFGVATFDLR